MAASNVTGYAAKAVGQVLEPIEYASPDPGEHEVRVSVTHCGVCYTDIQGIDDHYGISTFPFVPGHEIVGIVAAVGSKVRDLKEGDRVGIGWQGRSCMKCEWCLRGEEHLCADIDNCGTWKPYGGFASSVVVDGRFAYRIPAAMRSEHAAVLMCAGISVYAPLRRYAGEVGKRIAVVGVGGLGHLAIKFAHSLGCEVTAISSSPSKRPEALRFGAGEFIDGQDKAALRRARFSFDVVLYTSHADADWTSLVNCVKTKGKLVVIGFSDLPVTFDAMELVVHEMSMTGSLFGSPAIMRDMLSYAETHSVIPEVEQIPMAHVNEAIRKIKANQSRYRMVLLGESVGGTADRNAA